VSSTSEPKELIKTWILFSQRLFERDLRHFYSQKQLGNTCFSISSKLECDCIFKIKLRYEESAKSTFFFVCAFCLSPSVTLTTLHLILKHIILWDKMKKTVFCFPMGEVLLLKASFYNTILSELPITQTKELDTVL